MSILNMKFFNSIIILCIIFCLQNANAATDSSWSSKLFGSIGSILGNKPVENKKTKIPIVLDESSLKEFN